MIPIIEDIQMHWDAIGHLLHIDNEKEYDRAAELLNHLIDEIGDNEQHPLYEFLDTLGTVMYAYEEKHHVIPDCDGIEMLRFFIEEHGLAPSDLTEIGTETQVADILNNKRELTAKHLRVLGERFHVSPGLFV
jgi:HTH-type transcriptional regulator/antitoxin HigA